MVQAIYRELNINNKSRSTFYSNYHGIVVYCVSNHPFKIAFEIFR